MFLFYWGNVVSFYPGQGSFWAGWWDEPSEGTFSDPNTGSPLGFSPPWYPGEPNGFEFENCAIIWTDTDKWNDQVCQRVCNYTQCSTTHLKLYLENKSLQEICGLCELDSVPVIKVRGNFFCF